MKRNIYQIILVNLLFLSYISLYAQPELAKGFKYNENGSIYVVDGTPRAETPISFKVYDNNKVITLDQGENEFKAADIYGFTLKESGKKFISASLTKLGQPQFVEDLTPDLKRIKVVKSFLPDTPLMQKDSVIMGTWLQYILLVKPDGSRILVSGYKKIAEFIKDDCPELSNKISSKQKGYFLSLLAGSLAEELEIYHRIANEFDQCKK